MKLCPIISSAPEAPYISIIALFANFILVPCTMAMPSIELSTSLLYFSSLSRSASSICLRSVMSNTVKIVPFERSPESTADEDNKTLITLPSLRLKRVSTVQTPRSWISEYLTFPTRSNSSSLSYAILALCPTSSSAEYPIISHIRSLTQSNSRLRTRPTPAGAAFNMPLM